MELYIIGFLGSLGLTLLLMPKLIKILHKVKFGQAMREEGPQSHQVKKGTPTMGGMIFVIVPIVLYIILDFKYAFQAEMFVILFAYLSYSIIGFLDDFIIVVKKNNEGLKPLYKFGLQALLALLLYGMYTSYAPSTLYIPFLQKEIELGIIYFGFIFIMFTAESNATNLTDGLDGLCASTSIVALLPFIAFAFIQQSHSLALFLIIVLGSLIGYLHFNKYPARIFMGDTGSLALGALFAASAMVLKSELALLVIGGVFLLETLSVVVQVTYFKISKGKRIFRMAPLHHHFEEGGMKETTVVRNFVLLGIVFAILGFFIGIS